MSELEKEKQSLLDSYTLLVKNLNNLENDLKTLIANSWDQHMRCYFKNNTECIEAYSTARINHVYIKRYRKAHEYHCKKDCSNSRFDPLEMIKSNKNYDIKHIKDSVNCYNQCFEKSLYLIKDEIRIFEENIILISGFIEE